MDTLCLCGQSAYEYWNGLRDFGPTSLGHLVPVPRDSELLGVKAAWVKAAPDMSLQAESLMELRNGCLRNLSFPLHVLVSNASARPASMLQIGHVWSTSIPAGSLVKLCRGVYCCTPEYLLLQLSLTLPFSLLVELAYEFCGAYSTSHWGLLPYTRCQPLTSLESLRLYAVNAKGVAGTKGAKGATKLCRALGYAIGGSASPMETVVAMLLSLPKKHGGYGLPRPRLNHWLQVPGTLRSVTGRSEFFCDLYWLDRRFAVEYDGRPYHTGYSNLQKDYARDNGLDDFGIGVKTLMAPDVFNVDRFDDIARQIARRLNVRLREERMGKAWVEKRGQLRRELLDRDYRFRLGLALGANECGFYPEPKTEGGGTACGEDVPAF